MADEAPPASRWTTATTGVRSAATWLATAAGAAAAAVFGAGPIFKSDVDASDWGWRWVLVIALVLVGAAAVVYVIARLLALQVPIEITLDTLPPGLRTRIESNALAEYLPGDATTLEEFKQLLRAYSNAAVSLETAAKAEPDTQEKARLEGLAAVQAHNRDIFAAKREELYQLAAYEIEANRITPQATEPWFLLGGAAVLAVAAMALFTLVIGPTGSDAKKPEQANSAPTGGVLRRTADTADLWAKLKLDRCEMPPRTGQVPVFVLDRSDTDYHVQTIGLPLATCVRYAFSVPRDLVEVVVVDPVKATVGTPASRTASPTPSGPRSAATSPTG